MTIVGWSPEDDKINTITAVEPVEIEPIIEE